MIPLLTAPEMKHLEEQAIHGWGIPAILLQEHAALGALALLPPGEPLHILAGPGNNGGDALAVARLALLQGRSVSVWALDPQPRWNGDAGLQARLWEGLGGTYRFTREPAEVVPSFHGWVVDGLFGLGTRLPLEGLARAWVVALSGQGAPVLAMDLPSGLDPGASEVAGPAVKATRTACFGHYKICHGLLPSRSHCGEITLVPLPLLLSLPWGSACGLQRLERPVAEPDPWNTHKGHFGHVAIRAGGPGMSGAAVLAAMGALRMGVGLVTVLPDAQVCAEVAAQVPEAMVRPWEGRIPAGVDALLVGPGGITDIPAWEGPLVLDASALKAGEGAAWMARARTVITPHPGEFSRLFQPVPALGHLGGERLARTREVATGPGILVLKGAQSLVAGGGDPQVWVNDTGHRGLSTGGSGDFLAGMVAANTALWAKGEDQGQGQETPPALLRLRQAVAEAVWLHGAAADRLGAGPLLVRELGGSLAGLLRELNGGQCHA